MALPDPVIVVPGITASYLRDQYPLPPEDVWTVLSHDFERAALHPDDIRYEASEPAVVRAGQVFEIAYRELITELRHNLSPSADLPVPVYPFAYDWRQPLEKTEQELAAFVDEVIARTAITQHYARDGYRSRRTVNLVGHSMGGLVIAGYLGLPAASGKVKKVATLATPFRGSFEAIIKVTTGTSSLGGSAPSSREREAARLTPALYYLIPDAIAGITIAPGLPQSMYDPGCWQSSIVATIAEYIRLHGTDPNGVAQQAETLFASLLGNAQAHRQKLESLQISTAGLTARDWLCVVGVDCETRVRVEVIRNADGSADFRFHNKDRDNGWGKDAFTGDGTVPFSGAVPPFLAVNNLVCVTPDDFGYWEVQDRLTASVAGFHGILPNMDMLHRLIVRHFTGAPDPHQNTWGRPAPGVTNWQPPMPLRPK